MQNKLAQWTIYGGNSSAGPWNQLYTTGSNNSLPFSANIPSIIANINPASCDTSSSPIGSTPYEYLRMELRSASDTLRFREIYVTTRSLATSSTSIVIPAISDSIGTCKVDYGVSSYIEGIRLTISKSGEYNSSNDNSTWTTTNGYTSSYYYTTWGSFCEGMQNNGLQHGMTYGRSFAEMMQRALDTYGSPGSGNNCNTSWTVEVDCRNCNCVGDDCECVEDNNGPLESCLQASPCCQGSDGNVVEAVGLGCIVDEPCGTINCSDYLIDPTGSADPDNWLTTGNTIMSVYSEAGTLITSTPPSLNPMAVTGLSPGSYYVQLYDQVTGFATTSVVFTISC